MHLNGCGNEQHSYTNEQLSFWLLLQPLTNGSEVLSWYLMLLALVSMALGISTGPTHLPTYAINAQYWTLDPGEPQSKWATEMDRGLCMHSPAHRWGFCGLLLDHRGQEHDSTSQQIGRNIPSCRLGCTCVPQHMIRECWPAFCRMIHPSRICKGYVEPSYDV